MKRIKIPHTFLDEDLHESAVYQEREQAYSSSYYVPKPFTIITIHDGTRYIVPENAILSDKFSDDHISIDDLQLVDPLHDDLLLDKFYKVNIRSERSILHFCDQYGLLYNSFGLKKVPYIQKEDGSFAFLDCNIWNQSLNSFIEEVNKFRYLMDLYDALKSNNFTSLVSLIDKYWEVRCAEKPSILKYVDRCYQEENRKAIESARWAIVEIVDDVLMNHGPKLSLGVINGQFVQKIFASELIAVIYYKFLELLTSGVTLKRCLKCGSLFVPRRSDAEFCPPEHAGEDSLCRKSYWAMKHRYRKKVADGKMTIKQVADKTGRPIEEVQSWFEGFDLQEFAKRMKEKEDQQD